MTEHSVSAPLASLECVVLDCSAPRDLAEFYHALLGGTVNRSDPRWDTDDSWATLHTPSGQVIAFQEVDHYIPPQWPHPEYPQQLHLDLHVSEIERVHACVLDLGGELLRAAVGARVYADPAGHPFCVLGSFAR